jgi:hypothetical protein
MPEAQRISTPARPHIIAATTRTHFTIPVFPYVKKYILKKDVTCEPVMINEFSIFGKCVTLALRDNRARITNLKWPAGDKLTESLTIVLTKEQAELSPRLNKLLRLNRDLDTMFKGELISWILALQTAGIPPHHACKMFLESYGISDLEYSHGNAYRYWQRYKNPG